MRMDRARLQGPWQRNGVGADHAWRLWQRQVPQIVGVGEHEPAVLLQNVQNWIVRNLDLTQDGQAPQGINDSGKDVDPNSDEYMRAIVHILALGPPGIRNCGEPCTVRNIRLENLKVHDGSWNGIYAGAGYYQLGTDTYGYVDNVVIANVESWNHHKSGIDFTSTYNKTQIYPTTNVQVIDFVTCTTMAQTAWSWDLSDTVSSIGNECAFNGRLRDARLGCWTWDSEDTTIQFNESHHNMTPENGSSARDGGGFDCDLGSEDCLISLQLVARQRGRRLSALMQWPIGYGFQRGYSHNIHMRYNIGERDAKKLAGAIKIFGGPNPVFIHNNTIYYEPNRLARARSCSRRRAACSRAARGPGPGHRRCSSTTTSSSQTAPSIPRRSATSFATMPPKAPSRSTTTCGGGSKAACDFSGATRS